MDTEGTAFEREVERRAESLILKGERGTPEAIRVKVMKALAVEQPELYELHHEEMRRR